MIGARKYQVNWLAVRSVNWNFGKDVAAPPWPDAVVRSKARAVQKDVVAASQIDEARNVAGQHLAAKLE